MVVDGNDIIRGQKHGKAATYSIDNLSSDEEKELLNYLNFIRSKRK